MKHEYAEINGIRMHYVTAGEGKPVILLHGFPEYWGVWKQVMAELSKDHRVIAPDLRGYNLTSKPEDVEQYRIQHLVEDVRALAEHLGLKKFSLLSQDWGALVGWSFALRHPEYLERFVVIDITHPALFNRDLRENPEQQQASQYMLALRSKAGEEMVTASDFAFVRTALFEDAKQHGAKLSDADIADFIDALKQPGAVTGGLNYYRAAKLGPPAGGSPGGSNLLDDLKPEQHTMRVPTLVLWAEQDMYLLQSGLDGLEKLVPKLTLRKIPDATHWLSLEKPELVASATREFLARKDLG